eukprot:924959-Alexandrium_andersonii.AAC.1
MMHTSGWRHGPQPPPAAGCAAEHIRALAVPATRGHRAAGRSDACAQPPEHASGGERDSPAGMGRPPRSDMGVRSAYCRLRARKSIAVSTCTGSTARS